jgi:hypothetical protein
MSVYRSRLGLALALLFGPKPVEQRAAFGQHLGEDAPVTLSGDFDIEAFRAQVHPKFTTSKRNANAQRVWGRRTFNH